MRCTVINIKIIEKKSADEQGKKQWLQPFNKGKNAVIIL